jgi:hypothetical protein
MTSHRGVLALKVLMVVATVLEAGAFVHEGVNGGTLFYAVAMGVGILHLKHVSEDQHGRR